MHGAMASLSSLATEDGPVPTAPSNRPSCSFFGRSGRHHPSDVQAADESAQGGGRGPHEGRRHVLRGERRRVGAQARPALLPRPAARTGDISIAHAYNNPVTDGKFTCQLFVGSASRLQWATRGGGGQVQRKEVPVSTVVWSKAPPRRPHVGAWASPARPGLQPTPHRDRPGPAEAEGGGRRGAGLGDNGCNRRRQEGTTARQVAAKARYSHHHWGDSGAEFLPCFPPTETSHRVAPHHGQRDVAMDRPPSARPVR